MRQVVIPPSDGGTGDSDEDYRDDDSEVEPAKMLDQDEVQTAFDDILDQAKSQKLNLGRKENRQKFMQAYGHLLARTTRDSKQTLLHLIASTLGHKSLTRCTPLHLAIAKKNINFIDVVVDEIDDLDALLQMRCEHARNCIHAAIFPPLKPESTIALINAASEETLRATDQSGLTPLHLAVDYKYASGPHLRIVQALIANGDGALDIFTKDPKDLSVYEYHQFTRREPAGSAQGQKNGLAGERVSFEGSPERVNRKDRFSPEQQSRDGQRGPALPSVGIHRRDSELVHEPTSGPNAYGHHQRRTAAEDEKPDADGLPGVEDFKLQRRSTAGVSKTGRKGEDTTRLQEDEKQKAEHADAILREIKLYYLRTTLETDSKLASRNQHNAVRFLHGANFNNISLCFDYSEAPAEIFEDSFIQSYDHMNFDQVLRYVSFRRIELQKPPAPTRESRLTKQRPPRPKTGRGRSDLTVFFGWLRRKGVKHILKVIVDDLKDPPHKTILTACRNVRQLHLRWSGNRAILRAWSEPEGLPRLESLEAVHLMWDDGQVLESADRINIERLVQQGGFAKTQSGTNEMNLQSNRWLNCMDRFADEIQNVRLDDVKPQHDIKIALIDDGADPYVESLRGKIRGGESFDRGFPHENGPSPYYRSSKGHGTVMADMICRVCPMAKLYVYKLEMQPSLNLATKTPGQEYIAAESAALSAWLFLASLEYSQAVRAAITQKVDIISMSWTVKDTEDNHKGINGLREAVKDALDSGILLFCAAADTGAVTEVEYPWSFDQRRIFRIGAATADGRVWGPTGSPRDLSFILPGHKVVSRNPHREGALPDDFEERTGSSVATALAAGLAALILHCVRLGAIHTEREALRGVRSPTTVSDVDVESLKKHHNMHGVLRAIGLDEGQQRFIEVWRRFDGPAQELKSNSSGEALNIVAKLARDLVSGIAGGSS
ncbi:Peptidase-S8 domain-containing protein [Fusarium sp. LHS14.1]|nr:Peptidase-S8 domain-containing protein [Fusarium sp. LHS14.1]